MRNSKGFSLVELVVVMAIFIVIMIMMSSSFEHILRQSGQQSKSAMTQIEGIVGLEMLRSDVAQAGFALPWSGTPTSSSYNEVGGSPVNGLSISGYTYVPTSSNPFTGDASAFNDGTPWAVKAGKTSGGTNMVVGTYYLVLKSALLAINNKYPVGRFGFVNYTSNGNDMIHTPPDFTGNIKLQPGKDQIVTLLSGFDNTGNETRQLLTSSTGFSYTLPSSYIPPSSDFEPTNGTQTVLAYVISDSPQLRMPFNRADYYVYRPPANDLNFPMPASCSPNTGILFKAVAGHTGNYKGDTGENLIYPLLNCVGDMQVVLGLDSGSGITFQDPDSFAVAGLTADQFRSQLKEVRIYILAHEGKKDMNYTYPASSINVGEMGLGRNWTVAQLADSSSGFGADWLHYRWKVYSLAVQLKNVQ
jgi:type II secretory pathway pseudopilin PulG